MFNKTIKNEFLESVREDSLTRNSAKYTKKKAEEVAEGVVEAYKRIFKTSTLIEEDIQKDLFNFNLNQITELMELRNPSTKASARTSGRIVSKYINWAIEKGYSIYKNESENPLNISQEFFNKFVPEEKTQYLSVTEVQDVINYLINDQDALIVALLFNGVQGKKASEIRNLTRDDVDFKTSRLRVFDDKTETYRVVDLENDELNTLKLIKRAYLDTEYIKKNGEMEYNPRIKESVEMPSPEETEFIIKTGKTQGKHFGERATQFTVYNRIDMIRALEGLQDLTEKLSSKNIVRSGMIYEAKCLLDKEGGELDNDKLKRICDKFNVKNHWAIRDFVNIEVINDLYGENEN